MDADWGFFRDTESPGQSLAFGKALAAETLNSSLGQVWLASLRRPHRDGPRLKWRAVDGAWDWKGWRGNPALALIGWENATMPRYPSA